jgi:hypothetical protein
MVIIGKPRGVALQLLRRHGVPWTGRAARARCSEWRSAFSRRPRTSSLIPSARSAHRRLRSSPATALKPYSACSMAWRTSSLPHESEVARQEAVCRCGPCKLQSIERHRYQYVPARPSCTRRSLLALILRENDHCLLVLSWRRPASGTLRS